MIDELADELHHPLDVRGGVRIDGRALDADRVHRVRPQRLVLLDDLVGRAPLLRWRA